MRRHHEKTHVVDDFLARKQRAVVGRRLAELGEDVGAVARAPRLDLASEIIDHEGAALHASRHLRAGNWPAHDGDRSRHHVDEGALDLLEVRSDLRAEEGHGGEIEGQLLDRGIEQNVRRALLPAADPARDAAIEGFEIGLHRPALEGDRQRLAMQTVLVEIEQHQTAREQTLQQTIPALHRGEQLRRIEQDEFIRLGAEQRNGPNAEGQSAIHATVLRGPPLHRALGIGEQREGRTHDGPPVGSRNMGEIL